MAKIADRYLKLDPWRIIEEGFDPARSLVSESVFSLGNEYMGVRGYLDEGGGAKSLRGSYFNGVYEVEKTTGSAYRGIVDRTHFMVNAVDWLKVELAVDGERFDLASCAVSDFRRELDMRAGTLARSLTWKTNGGKVLSVRFLRFLDMEDSAYGYQRIEITPKGWSGAVDLRMANDFNAIHAGRKKCYWKSLRSGRCDVAGSGSRGIGGAILASTVSTEQRVFSGFCVSVRPTKGLAFPQPENDTGDLEASVSIRLPVADGSASTVDKTVYNLVEKNPAIDSGAIWNAGIEGLGKIVFHELDSRLKAQRKYWDHLWETMDIRIDGDELNQQGIRFCIFQMQQTYHGQNPSNNIGAKGLTGEAYNGHAFWDTETYCLPFYLFSNLPAARNLLEFRYSTLDRAKERAKMLDCKGACFPVATLNGDEACDLWQHASLQFQPSTAVAYGIAHYAHLSRDDAFLFGHGAELLVEISRFLRSRGGWNNDGTGFGFYSVMGPDEFHMMVNHNTYTNLLAKKTFEFTNTTITRMKSEQPEAWSAIERKTGVTAGEIDEWARCAEKTIVLQDRETGIFEQHEGYFNLPHIDVNAIPVTEFPLYHNWSYDRIYRTDMIKQPDVLMFMFLYNRDFTAAEKKANYEYYEPRTIHESSLSPSIHSIFASELGKHREAFDFFGFATRMDLDNYNRNSGEGLHTTSIAAAWVNIVYGFGGMRSDGEVLNFAPSLPAEWKGYEFRVQYMGAHICVAVNRDGVHFSLLGRAGQEIVVLVYDSPVTVTAKGCSVPLPAASRG